MDRAIVEHPVLHVALPKAGAAEGAQGFGRRAWSRQKLSEACCNRDGVFRAMGWKPNSKKGFFLSAVRTCFRSPTSTSCIAEEVGRFLSQ